MQMFFFSEAKYTPVLRFLQAQYVVFSYVLALFRHLPRTPETLTTAKNKVRTCLIIFLYLFDFLLYFPCTRYTGCPFSSIFLCSGRKKAAGGPFFPRLFRAVRILYILWSFFSPAGAPPRCRRPSGSLRPVRALSGPDPASGTFPRPRGKRILI